MAFGTRIMLGSQPGCQRGWTVLLLKLVESMIPSIAPNSANGTAADSLVTAIVGRRVRLRPVQTGDIASFYAWRSDVSTLALWASNRKVITIDEYEPEFQWWLKDSVVMVVTDKNSQKPRGFLRAYNLNLTQGWAWLQCNAAKNRLGVQGVLRAAEAYYLFTRYLFDCFPLRKICSEVYSFNEQMIAVNEKFGFREEGRLREQIWWRDRYWDTVFFGLMREEWLQGIRRLETILRVEGDMVDRYASDPPAT